MTMKRFGLALVFALVAGLAAFAVTRYVQATKSPDEMTWLKEEFHLTPAQALAIGKLHQAYEPVCADHCRKIMEMQERLSALESQGKQSSAEYTKARADWVSLCRECTNATQNHLERVAAEMAPEQGKRYLALVGPKLTQRDTGKPFGLR
jgi:hypothetical protein